MIIDIKKLPTNDQTTTINTAAADDYFGVTQKVTDFESEVSNLCCCEYLNRNNERYHILGCCCNCEEFDAIATSLTTCRKIDKQKYKSMLLTFQDRLRIPWNGGALRIAWDTAIPVVLVPPAILGSAFGLMNTIIIFIFWSIFVGYAHHYVNKLHKRTRFFFTWLAVSVIMIVFVFELTAPLLELLPEEVLVLTLLTIAAVGFGIRAKMNARLNHVAQSTVDENELPDITEATTAEEEEEAATAQTALLIDNEESVDSTLSGHLPPDICAKCRKYVTPRTEHCNVCNLCILRRDHHSFWLDCCIGKWNHRDYLLSLIFGELALLLGANLTLTAVCHPFLVVRLMGVPLMLPDDCSEVYDDYHLAASFVISVYALMIASCVLFATIRQFYYISRGITMHEHRSGHPGNRMTCLKNWKAFLLNAH